MTIPRLKKAENNPNKYTYKIGFQGFILGLAEVMLMTSTRAVVMLNRIALDYFVIDSNLTILKYIWPYSIVYLICRKNVSHSHTSYHGYNFRMVHRIKSASLPTRLVQNHSKAVCTYMSFIIDSFINLDQDL